MKVLVVDDSTTIRRMLARTLGDVHDLEVSEASNGVEALQEIVRVRFDLVILDVNMPVMDGLETLEAIRSSPAHAALPVVMLTSEKSEPVVRRLVELGITDYLSKPLPPDCLADRLARILTRFRRAVPTSAAAGAAGTVRTVLVVEQDPDRRHFLLTVLAPRCRPIAFDSAARALQACMEPEAPPLDLVLVGEEIGLPPLSLFVPKLRALPCATEARVIGFTRHGAAGDAKSDALLDATLEWSYVPGVFLARFEHACSGESASASDLPGFRSALEKDIACATEQLFGIMLSSDVTLVDAVAPQLAPWSGHGVHASIDLTTKDSAGFTVLFRAAPDAATAITAHLIGVTPGDVHEADVLSTASEFVNIIGGRLRNRLTETGLEPKMQLPRNWLGETASGFQAPLTEVSTLAFSCSTPRASFEVLLRLGATGRAPASA